MAWWTATSEEEHEGTLADPEARIGFGYVMNQMLFDPAGDPRSTGLLRALYDCL